MREIWSILFLAGIASGYAVACDSETDAGTGENPDVPVLVGACMDEDADGDAYCNTYSGTTIDATTYETNCENSGSTFLSDGCPLEGCVSRCSTENDQVVSYFYSEDGMDQSTCEALGGMYTSPCI